MPPRLPRWSITKLEPVAMLSQLPSKLKNSALISYLLPLSAFARVTTHILSGLGEFHLALPHDTTEGCRISACFGRDEPPARW